MAVYTLKSSIFERALEKRYIADILYTFIQDNPYKVAVDNSGVVLEVYRGFIEKGAHVIFEWLSLLSIKPVSIEPINVDLRELDCIEEIFLTLCCHTKGQNKMIVESHQEWAKFNYLTGSINVIEFNGVPITIYDKEEAIRELSSHATIIHAKDSLVAVDNSSISNSKN